MALGDPFQTTYEGSRQALGTFGEALQQTAATIAAKRQKQQELEQEYTLKGGLAEQEAMLKQRYKDPVTALKEALEIKKLEMETTGQLTDKEEVSRATTLRKEFNTDQAYKNYQILQRSADQMKEAYNLAISPDTKSRIAADQALAVTFQKMLDPTSVVRESEYARTPEGVALLNKMGSFVEQMQRGGLQIKDEDRLALIQASNKMLKSGKQQMNHHISRYESLAKDYKVKPALILGDIKKFDVERTFMLNGEPYEVPESEAQDFLKENPSAQEI